ncbi:5-methylcytosine-specific restriction endonuclease system specificity protein McrC [Sinobaca sp. H24]|uniref:5-methylcytosine-specific restriction endonuclease system specificity protein McrC n=1 Tax=Sinobaca sp. H24 TaxID=2923376 RepID=UPI00207ADD21|nr:5-methylcytosine-specific restriction endonuclease system specificity protein McrC [Sinobaca sp. H24]
MIKVQNIYYMLAYAFRFLKNDGTAHVDTESFDHAEDLYAALLVLSVSKQIKRGITKDYLLHTELLSSPRGRIDVSDSIKERALFKKQLICKTDEYTENTKLNQIIKTAFEHLIKSKNVQTKRKKEMKKLINHFQHVNVVNLNSVNWKAIQYNRSNVTYRMIISICEFIAKGILFSSQAGQEKHSQFIDDQTMHKLYEKFVLSYYQKHYPSLRPSASQIDWQIDSGDKKFLPVMKSDITLQKGEKIIIIDTKYYQYSMQKHYLSNRRTLHSNNLYQIYTYVKNKDKYQTGLVSGILLYAKTEEETVPNEDYKMDGNVISVKTIDLNANFSVIQKQLNNIAEKL